MNRTTYIVIWILITNLFILLAISGIAWSLPGVFDYESEEGCFKPPTNFIKMFLSAIDANSPFVTISSGVILCFVVVVFFVANRELDKNDIESGGRIHL